jgi:hypothetical protein
MYGKSIVSLSKRRRTGYSNYGHSRSKNISTHIRNVWRHNTRGRGVESVPIDDRAAFISGMQETHRTEFMEQENVFAMALQQLDRHDSDDELTLSSRRKKSQYAKVRDNAKKYDDTRLINLKLRPKDTSNPAYKSTRELKQKMIEAQLAFNVAMKKSLPWVGHYGISTCSKTLDVNPGAKAIRSDRQAEGLGGTRSITHQGISPLFGIEMAYINGGNTPNLLSVGTALQTDDNGQIGVAIFTHKGAIHMSNNNEIEAMVSALVDRATEMELVEGYATMKN